jgi:hypothetical protein
MSPVEKRVLFTHFCASEIWRLNLVQEFVIQLFHFSSASGLV